MELRDSWHECVPQCILHPTEGREGSRRRAGLRGAALKSGDGMISGMERDLGACPVGRETKERVGERGMRDYWLTDS